MMGISLEMLWTDYMIWGLMLALVVWSRLISRSSQVRHQWLQIFESRLAMISAILLMTYVMIALMDSVHFRLESTHESAQKSRSISGNQSLLDAVLPHLAATQERTYSAPFATQEYNKSLTILANGEVEQRYRPLQHIDPTPIWTTAIEALMIGLLISAVGIGVHLVWRARRCRLTVRQAFYQAWQGQTRLPWRTAYATFALVVVFLTSLYLFSQHYHVFGTDKVGGDVLYESLKSIRTGVLIGVLTTLVMLPLALFLGISAGLFRGWVDDVIQYLYTTLNSIPGVLLIAAAVLVMQTIMSHHPEWFNSTEERA
ncbi:MAG: ABC transporter permease, partial [Hydrogenovibrio sp.]